MMRHSARQLSAAAAPYRLVASKSSDSAVVLTTNLPKLSDARVYQLWTVIGASPTSAGIIKPGSDTIMMTSIKTADMMAITVEPAGGSKQPTTKPIATLTAA